MAVASTTKQWLLRLYRFALFAAILSVVHLTHRNHSTPPVENLPDGAIQTAPASDDIVGYAGPTNTLIQFDAAGRISSLKILSSADTKEHLSKVLESPDYFSSFIGLTRDEAASLESVDTVSGATLTCYAITNGIRKRLGATSFSPSRFSHVPTLAETKKHFPDAEAFVSSTPAADTVLGYQGPSLSVTALGADGTILGFYVPQTFDNQPYLDDALAEPYFMKTFNGLTPTEVAAIDLEAAAIEGVSGATLTSYALAEGVVTAMRAHTAPKPSPPPLKLTFGTHEIGTAAVTLFGILVAFSPLRGKRRIRAAFQVALVAYLGLTAGNILAQSLLVGWTRSGVPWQIAPGLAFLAASAIAVPWATKRNVYCDHLCPHGAAQQLTNRFSPFKNRSLPPRIDRSLRLLPGLTLLAVMVLALLAVPFNFAAIEPFNAYLLTIAGATTIAIAVASLIAALFTPLPYCKYACPTGAVLTFLRSRGSADTFSKRDSAALVFFLIAALFIL